MLDPYVRRTMTSKNGVLQVDFRLPDQYGVFSFKIDYNRYGLSFVEVVDTVQVRPYRHDQYPRYLVVAYPYYANIFSMMSAFIVFSLIFLFHRENVAVTKKNN
jgi:oligosaccharyltransferase complex subunit beta